MVRAASVFLEPTPYRSDRIGRHATYAIALGRFARKESGGPSSVMAIIPFKKKAQKPRENKVCPKKQNP